MVEVVAVVLERLEGGEVRRFGGIGKEGSVVASE